MKRTSTPKQAVFSLLVVMSIMAGLVASVFLPILSQHAAAADPTAINIIKERGAFLDRTQNQEKDFGTCTAKFTTRVKTSDLIHREFSDHPQIFNDDNDFNTPPPGGLVSFVGTYPLDLSKDQAQFVVNGVGSQTIPIIQLEPATGGEQIANDGVPTTDNSFCTNFILIPVSRDTWRGYQLFGDISTSHEYMEYKNGQLSYYGGPHGTSYPNTPFSVSGSPDWSGAGNGQVNVGGAVNARWLDASRIQLQPSGSAIPSNQSGEIFTKAAWNTRGYDGHDYSYYFLSNLPAGEAQSGRASQTIGSSSQSCDNPRIEDGQCGDSRACVPFIAVDDGINVRIEENSHGHPSTPPQLGDLQYRIDSLGHSAATYVDYNTSCAVAGRHHVNFQAVDNYSKLWLYYNKTSDSFVTAFSSGDGNEQKYIDQYAKKAAGVYEGGQNGCAGLIRDITSPGTDHGVNQTISFANWILKDGNCGQPTQYGTLRVSVLTVDDSFFNNALQAIGQSNADQATKAQKKTSCGLFNFSLNWLVCQVVDSAQNAVGKLDSLILSQLMFDMDPVFKGDTPYHRSEASFRNVALGVVALAFLVMIVAQAMGVDLVDAYTLRRLGGRGMFVVFVIVLWWQFGRYALGASNDVTAAVGDLIYAPFRSIIGAGHVTLGGMSLVGLLGTGGALAFGWIALLSFVVTALLAAGLAYFVIEAVYLLKIIALVTGPFWVACSILPGTQRIFKIGRDTAIGALLFSPGAVIIIRFARVGAFLLLLKPGAINQVAAAAMIIVSYGALPWVGARVGGGVSTFTGAANDRTRGAFDRLRKYRAAQPAARYGRFKRGEFFNDTMLTNASRRGPLGALGRYGNRMGGRVGVGARGRYGLGQRGRAAMGLHEAGEVEETLKNNAALRALANDDDSNGVLGLSGGTEAGLRQAAIDLFGTTDSARAQRAMSTARNFMNRKNAAAAFQTMAQNKSRAVGAGRWDVVQRGAHRLAEGNQEYEQGLAYSYQYFSRAQGGRADLGGNWTDPALRTQAARLATNTGLSQQDAIKHLTMLDGMGRTDVATLLRGHTSQVKQARETIKFVMDNGDFNQKKLAATRALELQKGVGNGLASGDNQAIINSLITQDLGIDLSGKVGAVAEQLVEKVTPRRDLLNANQLNAEARVYDQDTSLAARDQQQQQAET